MHSIFNELGAAVANAFEQCGYDKSLGRVNASNRPDLCQFQCNGAFEGAKLYKKAPVQIAKEVEAFLKENKIFSFVEAVNPGFINLSVTDEWLAEKVSDFAKDEKFGIPQCAGEETVLLDYGGPNVAKPLHIGHLRTAIIGEALKRIAASTGRKTIADIHLGDWGLHMGQVIAELKVRNPQWRCFAADFDAEKESVEPMCAQELNEIYPFASKKSKEDEAFRNEARATTQALQSGNPGYMALWKEIMRVSVQDMKKSYECLNVDFDLWYGESDSEKYVPELIEILTEKGLLYESDGAMVVDVAEESDKAPVPPVIVKKSDNSNIYATTDLATILQREKDFSPQRMWYVVDKRQSLHFTQVFRCAKKAGLVPAETELEHLGFGTMNGSDGKPYKTRDGGVMSLSSLLETILSAAYEKTDPAAFENDEQRKIASRKIGVAAIKFGDMINHRAKDYIFDIDKFLSFEGKTGTYLLYMITRIHSILNKLGVERGDKISFKTAYTAAEREIFLHLLMTGDAFTHAFDEKAPNYICEHAYQLASLFSGFYHDNHILNEQDEEKKQAWINLCLLTKKVLEMLLNVLGIETVERM